MVKIFTVFIAFIMLLQFSQGQADAEVLVENTLTENAITYKKLDREAKILAAYLAKYNSPMQYHAQDFVDAARMYDLDWKMLPAIAGVESTFGKRIPGGYNAYGWGVYGTNRIYFKSWTDGIYTVAKGLRTGYLNKGLKDPYSINRIYAASPHWGKNVTFFMNDLDKFEKQFTDDSIVSNNFVTSAIKIAAVSGQLVLK